MTNNNLKISNIAALLAVIPILGILSVQVLNFYQILTDMGIALIIIIVVLTTSTFVAMEIAKDKEDSSGAFFEFIAFNLFWIGVYPFYLIKKAKEGHKDYSLLGAASMFILFIVSFEMVRLGFSKVSDIEHANSMNSILILTCWFIQTAIPLYISSAIKSAHTSLVIILTAVSVILMPFLIYVYGDSLSNGIKFIMSVISVVLYLFAINKSLQKII